MSLRAEAEGTASSLPWAPTAQFASRSCSIVYKGAARCTTTRVLMHGHHSRLEGGGVVMSSTTTTPSSLSTLSNVRQLDVSPPALDRADGTSPPSAAASSPTDILTAGCRRDFLTQLRRKPHHQTSSSSTSNHHVPSSSSSFGGSASDADTLSKLNGTSSSTAGGSGSASSSFVHPTLLLSSYPLYYQRSPSTAFTTTMSHSSSSLTLNHSMAELAPLLCPPPTASTATPPIFLGTAIAVSPRILITTAHHYNSHKDDVGGFLVRLPHTLQVEHYLRRTLGGNANGEGSDDTGDSSSIKYRRHTPNIDASQTTVLIRVLYAQKKLDLDMCVLWLEESVPFFLSHEQFRSLQPFGSRFGGGGVGGEPSPPSSLPPSSTATTDSGRGLSAAMDELTTTSTTQESTSSHPLIVPGPLSSEVRATTVYYQPQYAQDVLSGYYELYHNCISKADADLESHQLALKAAAIQLAAAAKKRNATTKKAPPRLGKKIPAYASKKKSGTSFVMVDDVLLKEDTQSAAQIFLGSPERRVSQHQWVCSVVDAWSSSSCEKDLDIDQTAVTNNNKRGARGSSKGVSTVTQSSDLMRNVARLESKRAENRHMIVGTHQLAKYLNCWEPVGGGGVKQHVHGEAETDEDHEDEHGMGVLQKNARYRDGITPSSPQHKVDGSIVNGTIILFRFLPPNLRVPTYLSDGGTPQSSYPLTTNALEMYLKQYNPHQLLCNTTNGTSSSTTGENGSRSSNGSMASVGWEAHLSNVLCRDARMVSSTGSIVEAIGRGGGGSAAPGAISTALPRVAPHSCVVKGTITTFGSSGAPVVDTRTGRMLLGMHVASNASKSHHHATDKIHHHHYLTSNNNISHTNSNHNGVGGTFPSNATAATSNSSTGGIFNVATTRTSEFIMTSALIRALHILEVFLHPLNPNLQ